MELASKNGEWLRFSAPQAGHRLFGGAGCNAHPRSNGVEILAQWGRVYSVLGGLLPLHFRRCLYRPGRHAGRPQPNAGGNTGLAREDFERRGGKGGGEDGEAGKFGSQFILKSDRISAILRPSALLCPRSSARNRPKLCPRVRERR